MKDNVFYLNIGKGVLRAVIVTFILIILSSIITTYFDLGGKAINFILILITALSVIYGAMYSSRQNKSKGMLCGILVALIYMVILYIVSSLIYKEVIFNLRDLIRFSLALFVGALSGVLGLSI